MTILNENFSSVNEIYHRVKYLYFINPDNLLNTIISSKEFKEYTLLSQNFAAPKPDAFSELLDYIFSSILKASKPYTDYLDAQNNSHSFFGEFIPLEEISEIKNTENFNWSYTSGATSLMQISLQNQLIIDSFFALLKKDPTPIKEIRLTHLYDDFFQYGYFDLKQKISSEEVSLEHGEDIEKRAKYSQRRNSYIKSSDAYYSKQIFNKISEMTCTNRKNSSPYPTLIKPYLHLFAEYIYSDRSVHLLDKKLDKNVPLHDNYDKVFRTYTNRLNKINKDIDKLLFSYPMERNYGFSTLYPLKKLLSKIYTTKPSDSKRTFNDLDDHKLIDIINHLFHSPLIYSRAFFFKYACEAVIKSTFSDIHYLSDTDSIALGIRDIPKENNKIFLISKGLILLEEFILNLNNLVYPLLNDLWNIVIAGINQKISNENYKVNLNTLVSYIGSNYKYMTADYTSLSYEEITSIYSVSFAETKHNFMQLKNHFTASQEAKNNALPPFALSRYEEILTNFFSGRSCANMHCDILSINDGCIPGAEQDKTLMNISRNHALVLHSISTAHSLIRLVEDDQ